MSCPFAGMTRIRFKGSPRRFMTEGHESSGLSAGFRQHPSEQP